MRRPMNLARLSPLRRGFVIGLLRGRQQTRKHMRALAQSFDDELLALQHDLHEIAVEVHRQCYDRAIDEAVIERSAYPDMLLN